MNKLKRAAFVIALCFFQSFLFAQAADSTANEPPDFMSSNGKIYVVMAVVVVIVLGIFIYLINLDGKIKKLEKKG
jgi:CcmD family protein